MAKLLHPVEVSKTELIFFCILFLFDFLFQAAVLDVGAASDKEVVVSKTEMHGDFVFQVCWDYEGERIFTLGKEQILRSFDARTGELIMKVLFRIS